jgi:outer membrane receptor protein involved in Fe transport
MLQHAARVGGAAVDPDTATRSAQAARITWSITDMKGNSIRKTLWVAAITLAFATTANAQGGGLEEIVITARKVEESLQETPVAVSAFSSSARGALVT